MRIFISHSSDDVELAEGLVTFLLRALPLQNTDVFCTSVPGHGLSVGDNVNDRIRQAVDTADVLIGLLTPASLQSMYVTFELGARWGVRKPMFPILAGGLRPDLIGEPLSTLQCMDATDLSALHGLVDRLADELSVTQQPPGTYTAALSAFQRSAEVSTQTTNHKADSPASVISDEAGQLLLLATAEGAYNRGDIIIIRSMAGAGIQVGSLVMPNDPSDSREEALWLDAFRELEESGLITSENPGSDVYRTTTRGYNLSDKLRETSDRPPSG